MFTNEELLSFIKEKCEEMGISGYDISKNTSISNNAAYKILNGTTEKPRRKNLLEILEYLENRKLNSSPELKVNEPNESYGKIKSKDELYENLINSKEEIMKLMITIQHLKTLLDKHKIDYSHITKP